MSLSSFDDSPLAAHHGIWRGDELGTAEAAVLPTGHAPLDAQLPGGGWPLGALTELLQARPSAHAWQLLLPGLVLAVQRRPGPVVLLGAPCEPFAPALAAAGLAPEALMWVRSEAPAARLWACEQALRCADVAAVLAWLPAARVGELRRLQVVAAQHEALLFVCRPEALAASASPARLCLRLAAAGPQQMDVHILKRRGPPLAAPVVLPARSQRMAALLAASQLRRKARQQQAGGSPLAGAPVVRIAVPALAGLQEEHGHAVDRLAMAA